jgi:deazaflavin-dependent oxidoreductase (nitroreductase family)
MKQSAEASAIRIPHPKGLLRLLFRAPILLYKVGLGALLGYRFLQLEHRGRNSGKLRRTVIEVVDRDPQRGSFFVVSAWGSKADWYRNVLKEPSVRVKSGRLDFKAVATPVPAAEAERHMRNYAKAHPAAFRELGSLLVGGSSRDVEDTIRRFVDNMPVVEFVPAELAAREGDG